jgi:hypothetical protein
MGTLRFLAADLDLDLWSLRALQDQEHPRRSPMAPADHLVHRRRTAWFASLDRGCLFHCIQTCEPLVCPTNVASTRYHRDAICDDILPHI